MFSPRYWNCLEKSRLFWRTAYFLELFVYWLLFNLLFSGLYFGIGGYVLTAWMYAIFLIKSFINVGIYHVYVCIIQAVATDMRIAMTSVQPKIIILKSFWQHYREVLKHELCRWQHGVTVLRGWTSLETHDIQCPTISDPSLIGFKVVFAITLYFKTTFIAPKSSILTWVVFSYHIVLCSLVF